MTAGRISPLALRLRRSDTWGREAATASVINRAPTGRRGGPESLTLGVLRRLAGPLEARFLAFLGA